MTTNDLATLRKQAFRALNQDGLMEIMAGITLFICSAFTANPSLIFLVLIPFFVLVPALRRLQERYTFPRVGYAKLPAEDAGKQGRNVLVYVAIVFAAYVLALVVFGVVSEVAYWRRWAPALAGALLAGGLLFAAGQSGFARHYAYLGASLLGGVVFSLLHFDRPYENVQMFLVAMAVLMLICGMSTFVRFLWTHPLPAEEGSNEHA